MFWTFKLSFVVDILAFFDLATFWAILWKKWQFFFNLLVTLSALLADSHLYPSLKFAGKGGAYLCLQI